MEKSVEDQSPLHKRSQAGKLVWGETMLGVSTHSIGSGISGRIESRGRGLAGEKVPRRIC